MATFSLLAISFLRSSTVSPLATRTSKGPPVKGATVMLSLGLGASLFPSPSCLRSCQGPPSLSCYNPLVAANPEQRTAVEVIVSGLSGAAPVGRSLNVTMSLLVTGCHPADGNLLTLQFCADKKMSEKEVALILKNKNNQKT